MSIGIDFGSRCNSGVPASGVAGGVKAGLRRKFGGVDNASWFRSYSGIGLADRG